MITLRPAASRGKTSTDWLQSWHSFSFGDYFDPAHRQFGPLRVINEDIVAAGAGFPTHPHRDMEIVTYVMQGKLAHQDSLGNGSTITPGEVQRMSAGTGILHSEFNHSAETPVHLLQIWLLPEQQGITPGYEQKSFSSVRAPGTFTLLASPDGAGGSITVHQKATLHVLDGAADGEQRFDSFDQIHWVQMAKGSATVNGQLLNSGDGAAIIDEATLAFNTEKGSEALIFSFPKDALAA